MESHDTPIRVDHVGVAVESVADAEPVLLALGCEKLIDDTVGDEFRWVYYALGDASRLELVEPIAEDSFLTEYLDEHGPGLHHVTLEVADLDAVAAHLESQGLRVVDRREFDEYVEAFVSPRNPTGALFQLMEYREAFAERGPAERLFVNGCRVGESDAGNQ